MSQNYRPLPPPRYDNRHRSHQWDNDRSRQRSAPESDNTIVPRTDLPRGASFMAYKDDRQAQGRVSIKITCDKSVFTPDTIDAVKKAVSAALTASDPEVVRSKLIHDSVALAMAPQTEILQKLQTDFVQVAHRLKDVETVAVQASKHATSHPATPSSDVQLFKRARTRTKKDGESWDEARARNIAEGADPNVTGWAIGKKQTSATGKTPLGSTAGTSPGSSEVINLCQFDRAVPEPPAASPSDSAKTSKSSADLNRLLVQNLLSQKLGVKSLEKLSCDGIDRVAVALGMDPGECKKAGSKTKQQESLIRAAVQVMKTCMASAPGGDAFEAITPATIAKNS